jgi:eukaryotic-like serine/threonine-protein kinase
MLSVQAGSQIDHYSIESLVATTSTASIFRAAGLQTGCPVAIKIPHPEVEGDLCFFERFRREQEICERLDHPAVVKALADDKGSRVYMVMEWVEGQLLRQMLGGQGQLPVERAVRIAVID